ncbi:MAG: GNAT family N-acetyltransferase [Methanocellales archaeon]|nr:GNAT family N-acetyltransferase [Methanocellales archaeon]
MKGYDVSLLNKGDEKGYRSFVEKNPKKTIYHTLEWKNVIEDTFGFRPFYLMAKNDVGDVVGVLPLFEVRSLVFGNRFVSLPFFPYGGILSEDYAVSQLLLERAKELVVENGAKYLELKERYSLPEDVTPSLLKKVETYTFLLHLERDPQKVWRKLDKSSVRWGIKKAIKSKVAVREGASTSDLKDFYRLFLITRKHRGIPPYPFELYRKIWDLLMSQNLAKLFLAEYKGESIAAIIIYLYNNEIVYAHAGAKRERELLKLQPYHILLWKSIEHGCQNGFSTFDLHGATKRVSGGGLFDFKKRWCDEIVGIPYYYFLNGISEPPSFDPGHPRYALAQKLWSKLPIRLGEAMSPYILRHMG